MQWTAYDYDTWNCVFLLFPRVIDGRWVWLEYAERRCTGTRFAGLGYKLEWEWRYVAS